MLGPYAIVVGLAIVAGISVGSGASLFESGNVPGGVVCLVDGGVVALLCTILFWIMGED